MPTVFECCAPWFIDYFLWLFPRTGLSPVLAIPALLPPLLASRRRPCCFKRRLWPEQLITGSHQSQQGERSGQSVTCTKCFLRSFVCHLFKGNGVIHYCQKNSVLDLQEHLAPFPSGHCILPLSFQPCSFLLIHVNK